MFANFAFFVSPNTCKSLGNKSGLTSSRHRWLFYPKVHFLLSWNQINAHLANIIDSFFRQLPRSGRGPSKRRFELFLVDFQTRYETVEFWPPQTGTLLFIIGRRFPTTNTDAHVMAINAPIVTTVRLFFDASDRYANTRSSSAFRQFLRWPYRRVYTLDYSR